MEKIDGNELHAGHIIILAEGKLLQVVKAESARTGKGGGYNCVELKCLKTGAKHDMRFRSSEKVPLARVEDQAFRFLYEEGTGSDTLLVFMDPISFTQVTVPSSLLSKNEQLFLIPDLEVKLRMFEDEAIGILLPERVTYLIAETDTVLKSHTITSSYKPALLNTGAKVMVPQHLEAGDSIVVNPQTGEFVERAKKQ